MPVRDDDLTGETPVRPAKSPAALARRWVEIDGALAAGYSWHEVEPDGAGGWTAVSGGWTSTDLGAAYEATGQAAADGSVGELWMAVLATGALAPVFALGVPANSTPYLVLTHDGTRPVWGRVRALA